LIGRGWISLAVILPGAALLAVTPAQAQIRQSNESDKPE
jgi:hypothetical protein